MSFGKNLGVCAVLFALFNFIFAILFQVVAGDIGAYFGSEITVILGDILVFRSSPIIGTVWTLSLFEMPGVEVLDLIMELLWILLPGILAAVISSLKFADESPKTAYWASTLGMFLMVVIALVLDWFVFGGTMPGSAIQWITSLLAPLLASMFFAGFGAMSSSSF